MVIPADHTVESKCMALKGNHLKADNFKWSERPARLQNRFLVLRKLGQGTYGKVQLALNKETNQEVAIKTIKKARIESEEDMLRIRREIYIMTSIRHPHIIHITEVFETRQKIVIVMQYASGGELYEYLGCHHTLPEEEARRLFRQISSAIYYCHKNKICHRDLKLENILLDEEGNAQIADFGLSNIFDDRRRMNTFCGSPLYASPEIVKGTPYKGPEVDCWSLGVLLYTLIYGTMPFDGRNFKELVSQISEGRYEEPICKSNASGLIRRLLTPDISKRATILDVCKDSWVNQGYEESLLNKAECMATEALFKVRKMGAAKSNSEKTMKNGVEKLNFSEASRLERHNERKYSSTINENSKNSNNFQIPQKVPLHEQMLNYDVKFVINKLLTAVESAVNCQKLETNTSISASAKENTLSNFKHWPRNGENNLASKVDSAYVIPIFEVTSVVPKTPHKIITNHTNEGNPIQNNIPNGFMPLTLEIQLNNEAKTNKAKMKKKEMLNSIESLSPPTKNLNSTEVLNNNSLQHLKMMPDFTDNKPISSVSTTVSNEISETRDNVHIKRLINHEGISSRNPSVKAKRAYENSLFGQKLSPFFRSKNNSLSLARIFSMKYEKLIINKFTLPERKQKPPGKIVIPATFDPSVLPSDSSIQEQKQIVVFPTISVSENKEKIEKKIDKIKKAALNMNLIRRSNSKNRLRIQKFLKSQAKKMQDLVCDEQRCIADSIEHINKHEGFPIPDAYFSKFDGGNFNAFNIKMHNKKINFMYSNGDNSTSPLTWDASSEENWRFGSLGSSVIEQTDNFGLYSITKSESDSQCSFRYKNKAISTSLSSSVDTQFGNFLTVPNNDYKIKLIRSASDSKGMNAYRQTSSDFNTDERHSNDAHLDGSLLPLKVETSCFDTDNLNVHLRKYSHCKSLDIKHNGYSDNLNLREVTDQSKPFKSETQSTKLSGNEIDEKNLYRSISMNSCSKYQINNEIDFSDPNHMASSSFHENGNHCNTNNLSKLGCNRMEKTKLPWLKSEINEMHYEADEKKNVLKRRNTMSCVSVSSSDIAYPDLKNTQEKCTNNCSDLYYYPWIHHSEQDLVDQQKIDTKFSSFPNLCPSPLGRKLTGIKINDSKSIDSLNPRVNDCNKILHETSSSPILPSAQAPSEKSEIIRQILYRSLQEPSSHDYGSSRRNRAKSVIEDALWQAGIGNALRTVQSERKTSLPQTNQNRSAFLSKFLNELENREQPPTARNSNVAQRHFSPRGFSLGKKTESKSEKRKQSFLQLLSLKRIQEAEKELDKADRDIKIDAEEDSAGSLLEALKTHGYKGVISQRFQGSEDKSLDTFNLKNPNSPFLSKKLSSNMSRLNAMYYDTLPHLSTATYDVTDWDTLGRFRMRSPYEMYNGYVQNSPKQSVYDWLTVNQNGDFHTPFIVDQDSILEPEMNDSSLKEMENSNWRKETSRSCDDEISSLESLDVSKDQYINGGLGNETNKSRECFTDYDELPNYGRTDRNPLLRTSSTSEDEREESVQDRIWRKSFYSRFNNSALSRKERSTFLESQFPSESRMGFNRNSPVISKSATRDSPDSIKWNGYTSDLPSKRIHESKKYLSTNDMTATGKAKVKPTRTSRQTSLETSYVNGETSVKAKLEETEPEH